MKYFSLSPKDNRSLAWIFFEQVGDNPLRLRERYRPLQCKRCGKFNEDRALELGFEPNVKLHIQRNFFLSDDGLLCARREAQSLLETLGIGGVKFIHIPKTNYLVMAPTELVETDFATAGFKTEGSKCRVCSRYPEVYFGPRLSGMRIPDDPNRLFGSNIWLENHRTRTTWLFASEIIVEKLKAAKIKDFEFHEE